MMTSKITFGDISKEEKDDKHKYNKNATEIFRDVSEKTGWFPCDGFMVKVWVNDNDDTLCMAVLNSHTFTKFISFDVKDEENTFDTKTLHKMCVLFGQNQPDFSMKLSNEGAEGVHIIIEYEAKMLGFTNTAILQIPRLKETNQELILFRLNQIQQKHDVAIAELNESVDAKIKSFLHTQQSIILLPASTKNIDVYASKLILDGRDIGDILRKHMAKDDAKDDVKDNDDDDDEKQTNCLLPSKHADYAQYANTNNVHTTIQPFMSALGISAANINGCNSCTTLCNCNANHQYSRNKLLMVMFNSMQRVEKNIIQELQGVSPITRIVVELADVMDHIMNPEYVGFRGADISGLSRLHCIQFLQIQHNDRIIDISPLRALETLKTLKIENCCQLARVNCIGSLRKLKVLSFYGSRKVEDITKLGHLSNLIKLDLRKTAVINVTAFHKYAKLEILYDRK